MKEIERYPIYQTSEILQQLPPRRQQKSTKTSAGFGRKFSQSLENSTQFAGRLKGDQSFGVLETDFQKELNCYSLQLDLICSKGYFLMIFPELVGLVVEEIRRFVKGGSCSYYCKSRDRLYKSLCAEIVLVLEIARPTHE